MALGTQEVGAVLKKYFVDGNRFTVYTHSDDIQACTLIETVRHCGDTTSFRGQNGEVIQLPWYVCQVVEDKDYLTVSKKPECEALPESFGKEIVEIRLKLPRQ
ncbi:MAG: hypothetical protein ACI9H6_000307 [Patiriisocius sp.]|jgi:hypothetical protein